MIQISFFPMPGEDIEELKEQAERLYEYAKRKRKWENAFQKWSDEQFFNDLESYGACGYGSICDWCRNNSNGRPCVRALNEMLRHKHITIDYADYDFGKVWNL